MALETTARFSLRVPESWFEFDIWRATRTGDLARLVDQRLADLPELRPQRPTILRALRQLAEDAERRGALYCAAAADRINDDGMLLATLMVFGTGGMLDPALNTVEAIAAQLTASAPDDASSDWREVRIIDLDAGRAVRTHGVSSTASADGDQILRLVSMHTLVPVPGDEDVLDVVLTSPLVSMSEGLLDLFDAISSTLTWRPGPAPA